MRAENLPEIWLWARSSAESLQQEIHQAELDYNRARRRRALLMTAAAVQDMRQLMPQVQAALFTPARDGGTPTIVRMLDREGEPCAFDEDDLTPIQDYLAAAMELGMSFPSNGELLLLMTQP